MVEINKYAPGMFCWLELATTDAEAARQFYSGLFGWRSLDTPAGPDAIYTMLQVEGKDIGALYQMSEQEQSGSSPPHWLSYISVESADETSAKARALGGKVVKAPFDVLDVGRMALIQDPTGAIFAVWQPRKHFGAQLIEEPGTPCWNELATTDRKKAAEFYSKLFGWGTKTDAGSPMPYTEFINASRPIGGMLELNPAWGAIPPHWMGYFAVDDCDRSVQKARELGGEIRVPPTDIQGVGRFAVVHDPQGAVFAVIKLTNG